MKITILFLLLLLKNEIVKPGGFLVKIKKKP